MRAQSVAVLSALALAVLSAACTTTQTVPATDSHTGADHALPSSASGVSTADGRGLPSDAAGAAAPLNSSPRPGEWAMICSRDADSILALVGYPERSGQGP